MAPAFRGGLYGLTLAAFLLVTACGGEAGGEPGEAADGEPAGTPAEVTRVQAQTLSVTLSSAGSLEAAASARVAPEINGTVARILFREGARVEAGDAMVRLEDEKLAASLRAAEATLERLRAEARNLERQLERNQGLLEQGAISRQTFDDLETAYESARAQLAEAEANAALARRNLLDATVRAPFTGRVGDRDFHVGDYVREGEPLFTIVSDDTLEVDFTVPERYVGSLTEGSPVQVRVRSHPDRWFDGVVFFVSPTVRPESRTVMLKAEVPNLDGELRAGQFADVRLELDRREDAVVVPESAVMLREGANVVFRVRDGRAEVVRVDLGHRERGRVEILSGIEAGDSVVVAGQQRLDDGSAVAPQTPREASLTGTGPGPAFTDAPARPPASAGSAGEDGRDGNGGEED